MNITNLRPHGEHANHWEAEVDGTPTIIVTSEDQDPMDVIREVMSEPKQTYSDKRVQEYPSIQEQLDMIYHDIEGWRAVISAIKEKHPKVE